jgi:hypothetical protein
MKFEFSKTLINHCNQCFIIVLLLDKTYKGLFERLENDIFHFFSYRINMPPIEDHLMIEHPSCAYQCQ